MAARLRLVLFAAAALLSLAAGAAGAAWFWAQDYLAAPGPLTSATVVDLPRGSGVTAIAGRLTAAGAIEHPWVFAALARVTGKDRSLKAGEYAFAARHVARRGHGAARERQGRPAPGRRCRRASPSARSTPSWRPPTC